MQVNAAAKNMIRMLRMDCDCIPIRNLTFRPEMTPANFLPCLTSIGAAENTEDQITPIAQSVLSESINHARLRGMKYDRVGPVVLCRNESFSPPAHSAVTRNKHPAKILESWT